MRVTFEHSLICDNGVLIANYAKQYGITTIFVPVTGDDITSLLQNNPTTVKNLQAMMAVANVYVVDGSPTWLATPSTLPSDVPSLVTIAGMFPQIAGIFYDVDPEQATNWNSARQSVITSYFTLVQTLTTQSAASAFKQTFFVADDDWSTLQNPATSATMLTSLQAVAGVSGVILDAPGNSAAVQLSNVSASLSQMTKPFWVESGTSKFNPASYYGVSPATLQANLAQLQQSISAQNNKLLGIEVNGWSDLYDSLQSILPQPPVFNGTLPSGPLVPPLGTTYLGAYANPNGDPVNTPADTAAFESQIGRKLAFNIHYYGFNKPFPGPEESDDVANGRIPFDAWNCGDSDANVAAGKDDATLIATADAIKAFGYPIFLRWFWEMNLDDTNNGRTSCYDANTDLPGGYFSPANFILAWQHIRNVFAAQGVTNVIWVWCVSNAHGGPGQYYPGDDDVDWVAMDDYDTNSLSFQGTFFILGNELAQFQEKPLMISETAALSANQQAFLTGAASVLQSQYPQVRAFAYLDATGAASQGWTLTSTTLPVFASFATSPYMSAFTATP